MTALKVAIHPLGWQRTGPRSRFLVALSRMDFEGHFDLRGLDVGLEIAGLTVRARVVDRLPQTVGVPAKTVISLANVPNDIGRGVVRITGRDPYEPTTSAATLAILGDAVPSPTEYTRELPALVMWNTTEWCCEVMAREQLGRNDPPFGKLTVAMHGRDVAVRKTGWEPLRAGHWTIGALASDVLGDGRMWLTDHAPTAPTRESRPRYVEEPSADF